MFQHIFVPLDGSQLAECVLPHLGAVAEPNSTQVTVVRVLETRAEGSDQPVDLLDWQFQKSETQTYLDRVTARIRETGVRNVEALILEGSAADQIIESARQKNADLILLSSHGKSGFSRWNVSGVVRKIVQNANLSIMLVRAYNCSPADNAEPELKYRKIMVPLDGSLRSEVALPIATELAQFHQARLVLAHIIHRPNIIQRVPPTPEDQEMLNQVIERSQQAAQTYMEQFQGRLPVEFDAALKVSNNVTHSLHEMVEEHEIDLMVLSAHGHSADPQRSFGNVSTGLIEYGTKPMITIQDLSLDEVAPTQAEEAARERRGY
jgi:nucleotide-binding universal stress UspA family protein